MTNSSSASLSQGDASIIAPATVGTRVSGDTLILEGFSLALTPTPKVSASGKSFLYSSEYGFKPLSVSYQGRQLKIQVSVIAKNDGCVVTKATA